MTAAEVRAREQVLLAAARLAEEGLIERTWGNVSVRVSEDRFLITPSGLSYETMREDQLAMVNITDGSWEGSVKPSSEKGVHTEAYRLRPEAGFVIHTHQYFASVAGIEGRALTGFSHPALGKRVPCAAYGLPGTRTLMRAAAVEMAAWPDCQAFLLRSHGALCLGTDMEDAFAAARALEEVSGERVRNQMEGWRPPDSVCFPWGDSRREGDGFWWRERLYPIEGEDLPPYAAVHAALYRAGDFQYILHAGGGAVQAVSEEGALRPWLDDLAQIAGPGVRCVQGMPPDIRRIERAVRGRNAVLLRGGGALCAGQSRDEAEAVGALVEKGCMAQLYAGRVPGCRPLRAADAGLQRLVYQRSYRKKGETC